MSEGQKLVTSIAGTVIGHLLLLALVGFLLFSERGRGAVGTEKAAKKPREVTIALDELMERVEKVEPEPQPVEEPEPPRSEPKPFLDTDLATPTDRAPENVRYESDRSTVASTERLPDPAQPREQGPTLAGDNPSPHLQLQNRDYTPGKRDRSPGASAASGTPSRAESGAESRDASVMEDARENREADPTRPTRQSDRPRVSADSVRERFFTVPSELGESTVPEESLDGFPARDRAEAVEEREKPSEVSAEEAKLGQPDESAGSSEVEIGQLIYIEQLVDGFSPEEAQNSVNGTLTNRGENAADTKETPLGRYKKAVKDAVAQTWHRYQAQHSDAVGSGILKLTFRVDSQGRVKGLKAVNQDTDSVLTEFSLRAVKDAEIPPMPEEVSKVLGTEGLELKYDIIIY